MRQVVLDTETTGLEPSEGHRIIEIGAIELNDRRPTGRQLHCYLNPQRQVEQGALEVHGLSNDFLKDKPRFVEVVDELIDFVRDSELVIHNAPFDLGFLDHELALLPGGYGRMADYCTCLDSLELARQMHPGMRNSLDALCKRYDVDNTRRTLHGALLDAQILAEVYLAMTGGQTALSLKIASRVEEQADSEAPRERPPIRVRQAAGQELADHQARLQELENTATDGCRWLAMEEPVEA